MPIVRRVLLAAVLTAGLVPAAWAQLPPARLRGTIAGIDGDTLTLTTRDAQTVKVTLRADTAVTAVIPARLDDIKPGSFIGTAAMPGPNGSLIALEVHVFPESMRGTGEGHRPFDLQPESTMTNGTVGDVVVSSGRTLTVGYKGGEKTVTVPPDVPVVGFEPGDRSLLVVGAHAILFGTRQADGSIAAARVLVGKDGLVPPM
jgi:hypothetical protein